MLSFHQLLYSFKMKFVGIFVKLYLVIRFSLELNLKVINIITHYCFIILWNMLQYCQLCMYCIAEYCALCFFLCSLVSSMWKHF